MNRFSRYLLLLLVLVQLACMPTLVRADEDHDLDSIKDTVQEKVHDVVDEVQEEIPEPVKEAAETVEEKVEHAQETVTETVQAVKETVVPQVQEKGESKIAVIKDKINGIVEKVVAKSKTLVEKAKSIRKNDAKKIAAAVIGAWGLSVAVGYLANNIQTNTPTAAASNNAASKKGKK